MNDLSEEGWIIAILCVCCLVLVGVIIYQDHKIPKDKVYSHQEALNECVESNQKYMMDEVSREAGE